MKYTPRLPETNVNVSSSSALKEFFVLVSGVLGIIIGLYVILGFAVDFIALRIPAHIESALSLPLLETIPKIKADGEDKKMIQEMVDSIQQKCVHLPYRFTVHIAENPVVNAVALPGGHIVVFSGLIEKMESENELAFVLAHEMGHFANRDHLRRIGRSLVFMTIMTFLAGADSDMSGIIAQWLNIAELGFSREQESAADRFGLEVIDCFYGHISGAEDFFEKIGKEKDISRIGHFFSTHPQNKKRISDIREYAKIKEFQEGTRKKLPLILNKNGG